MICDVFQCALFEFIKNLKVLTNRKIIKAIPVRTIQDVKISEEFKNFCDNPLDKG